MRWVGYVAHMGEMRNIYKALVEAFEGKIPPGRRSRRWEDNIKRDLGKRRWEVWTGCL